MTAIAARRRRPSALVALVAPVVAASAYVGCVGNDPVMALGQDAGEVEAGADVTAHTPEASADSGSSSPCVDSGVTASRGCPEVLVKSKGQPLHVIVTNGRLFWTNAGDESAPGSLFSAAADGTSPTEFVPEGAGVWPRFLAARGSYVFWGEQNTFNDTDATGAVKQKLADGGGSTRPFIGPGGGYAPRGIAVDDSRVYFVTVAGQVMVGELDGGATTSWQEGLVNAIDIDVDDAGIIYDQAGAGFGSTQPGAVSRRSLDGAGAANLAVNRPAFPWGLASDGEKAYWAERGLDAGADADAPSGTVSSRGLAGAGLPTTLCSNKPSPLFVALDGPYVYFTSEGLHESDGELNRVRKDGMGNCETLVAGLSKPHGIFVGTTHVYWTTRGDGRIWRMEKPGT